MNPLYPALKRLPFSGFQSLLIADRKRQCNPVRCPKPRKKANRSCSNRSHRELLLETICVSPVVFLVFAAWETPSSGAQRRRTGEGLPCCEGLKKTRGGSMLEEGAPCVTGCQWTTDGFTGYLSFTFMRGCRCYGIKNISQ
ncbi:MAG: hypothetical protein JRI35_01940 [Deltaproteobacteria bacterium]|nr:hypothetical protein [Deltaproteobacteria bacterium]